MPVSGSRFNVPPTMMNTWAKKCTPIPVNSRPRILPARRIMANRRMRRIKICEESQDGDARHGP